MRKFEFELFYNDFFNIKIKFQDGKKKTVFKTATYFVYFLDILLVFRHFLVYNQNFKKNASAPDVSVFV